MRNRKNAVFMEWVMQCLWCF